MLRKISLVTLLTALCLLVGTTQAQVKWQEGTHYKVVKKEADKSKGVVEVFSYWCPACFQAESIVAQIQKDLPQGTKFTKSHVDFMGATSKDVQSAATVAMLIAKASKKEAQFNKALFESIHVNRQGPNSEAEVKALAVSVGIDAAKYDKLAKSFGLKNRIKANDKLNTGIRRVPTFIINDKFQPIFTRDMTADDIVELVVWLSQQA